MMDQESAREQEDKAAGDLEMAGQERDVGDTFFDSEDDDAPVDMEVVFEAMKHVPLPDFDYAERDDAPPSAAVSGSLPAEPTGLEPSETVTRKSLLKGSSETGEAVQIKKKGASKGRPLKRVKIAGNAIDIKEKSLLKPVKGSAIATAAKVAAEVAPDVVTGGIVAEAGPRPDFSLWTVEDDLLLKNAIEAGAAVEALAKGAMRFSHRFTVRELRERWRALLYDPEISAEAATRMVEAEAALTNTPPQARGPQDHQTKHLHRKRRLNSIRTLYYKKRRILSEGKVIPGRELKSIEDVVNQEVAEIHEAGPGVAKIVPSDMMVLGNVDSGIEATTDFEDRTFSQMVSLLATGGVGAVIGALPGNLNIENVEADLKAREDSERRFEAGEPKLNLAPESGISTSRPNNEAVLESDSQTSEGAGIKEGLRISPHTASEKGKETLQLSSTQIPLAEQREDGQGGPLISGVKGISQGICSSEEAVHVIDGEHEGQNTVGMSTAQAAGHASQEPPHMKLVDGVPQKVVINNDSFRLAKVQEVAIELPSSKNVSHINENIVKTELPDNDLGDLGTVKLDVIVQDLHPASQAAPEVSRASRIEGLRVEVPEDHQLSEDDKWLTSELRDVEDDDDDEGFDPLHVHWKHSNVRDDKEGGDDRLEFFIDYEGDNEGDNEDKNFEEEYEVFDEGVDSDMYDASDSPSAMVFQDSPAQHLDEDNLLDLEQTTNVMMDPVLGPIVCTLSTEDTEIPNLDDSLALPIVESPLIYASEGEGREDDPLDCTSPDDEIDIPGSPSEFHVYEELESPDMLEAKVNGPRYEGDNTWSQGRTAGPLGNLTGRAFFQSSIPVAGSPIPLVGFGGALGEEGPCLDSMISEGPSILMGEQVLSVEGEGDEYRTEFDPQTGQEILVRLDPDTGEPRSDGDASPGEIEEEPESDPEMARFSDVETMIMNMDLDPGVDDEFSALEESRRMYRQQRKVLVRLEQSISAAMQRSLTKRKALAILYGQHLRYYMTKTEVSLGRMTQDNIVDIDLGKEGRANKVSRQQAFLKLKEDGVFYLRNLGRRSLTVNNIPVDTDQRAILGSNCLIEVGGMRFIFEINKRLVNSQMERMHRAS